MQRLVSLEQVKELLEELKEIDNAIAQHASEHIHANEVILTFAAPRTTKLFLQQAAKKRSFQVGPLLLFQDGVDMCRPRGNHGNPSNAFDCHANIVSQS